MYPEYISFKSRRYKVHEGKRGGHYMMVKGKKHYIKSTTGGTHTSLTHTVTVFENASDNKDDLLYHHRVTDRPYDLLSILFPSLGGAKKDVIFQELVDELFHGKHSEQDVIVNREFPYESKLLVIGDVHGDANALMNTIVHWYKSGYLNPNGTLKENTYIISTGDLVDYTHGSMNVLYAMLKLRQLNPDKVMLLSGNHEGEWWVSGKQHLYDEITKNSYIAAIGQAIKTAESEFDFQLKFDGSRIKKYVPAQDVETYGKFTSLVRAIGPCMLLAQYQGDSEVFAFMHGMWPVVVKNGNELYIWSVTSKYDIPMHSDDQCIPNFRTAIMWNDLAERDTDISKRGLPYAVEIGSDVLHIAMKRSNVKAIVRGHQDLCFTQQGLLKSNYHHQCEKGVAVTQSPATGRKMCKHEFIDDGWCKSESIVVSGIPSTEDDATQRVLTSSMAFEKTGGTTCMGAYILIEPYMESQNGGKNRKLGNRMKKGGMDTYPEHGEITPWSPPDACPTQDERRKQSNGGYRRR